MDRLKQKAIAILQPPFKLKRGFIYDSSEDQNMVCDSGDCEIGTIARIRGWGRLSKLPEGSEIQDAIGEIIVEALNDYFNKIDTKHQHD